MKKASIWEGIFLGLVFGLWLLHPQLVKDAIGEGLTLCIQVVFPSLFPFFVLSHLLIGRNHQVGITSLLGRWMGKLGLPAVGASSLVLGALGGYPMGAVTTYQLYNKGHLTRNEATHLLGCSNFAGPGYIFGVLGLGVFSSISIGCMLYLSHILAGILVARTTRRGTPIQHQLNVPCETIESLPVTLAQALKKAVAAMATVCSCIVFFFLVLSCLRTWCLGGLPPMVSAFLCGLVEMTAGTSLVSTTTPASLALVGFCLGWGGLCIHMQVHALGNLPMLPYYGHKFLHGIYGAVLTPLMVNGPLWGMVLFALLYGILPLRSAFIPIRSCNLDRHRLY